MRRSLHVILLIALLLQQFSFLSFNTPAEVAQAASFAQEGEPEPVSPPESEYADFGPSEPIVPPPSYDGTEPLVFTEIHTEAITPTEISELAIDPAEEPQPGIILTSDSQVILDRQQVRLSWEANQIKVPDTANWVLQLPLSLYPVDFGFSTIDEEAGIGTVNLRTRRQINDLVVQADEFDAGPFIVVLQLWDGEEQLAETSLTLETPGLDRIQPEGGAVRHPYLPVEVRFGANENRPALNLRVHDLPADNPVKLEPGLLEPAFEVLAYNKAAESLVTSFEEQIEIEVYIGTGYEVAGLVYYDESEQAWLPIPSDYNPETGIVTGYTTHFTAFSIDAAKSINANIPNLSTTQVGSYTGAATTSYPLWTPPGIAGLQPSLALTYNSQAMDSFIPSAQQVSWVGGGWSLDTGYIERDTHGTSTLFDDDTFNLVVNGVSMRILKTSNNLYRVEDENYWKIEKIDDATGFYWRVYDKTGAIYVFGEGEVGDYDASRAKYFNVYPSGQCPQNATWTIWRWGLTKVIPAYGTGNEIEYTYTKETIQQKDLYCNPQIARETQIALYPEKISYAGGLYEIRFFLETRNDYQTAWGDQNSITRLHGKKRLDRIEIWTDQEGGPPYALDKMIRSYDLSYTNILPGWKYTNLDAKVFSLASIKETVTVGNNVDFPLTTYTYGDGMHLTKVENGYGGKVEFNYQVWYDQGTLRTDSKLYSDRNKTCPDDWKTYYNGGVVSAYCNDWRVIIDGQNFSAGHELEKFNGRIFTTFGHDSYQPGGAYYFNLRASTGTGASALYADLDYPQGETRLLDGIPVPGSSFVDVKHIWVAPTNSTATIVYDRLRLRLGRSPYTSLYLNFETDVYMLTTRWRVTSKTVTDQWSGESNVTSYVYDGAATNDKTHSAVSAANNNDPFRMYTPIGAEYRGNAFFQEILPSVPSSRNADGTLNYTNHTRMTWFNQDDNYKGQPLLTLAGWHKYSQQFEDGVTPSGWTVNGNGTVDFRIVDNDKAWYFESGGPNVGATRTANLGNGQALLVHFRTNGSGEMKLLATGSDNSQFGIRVSGGKVYRTLNVSGAAKPEVEIMSGFKSNTWYYMLLMFDNDHLMVRVQERTNPNAVGMNEVDEFDIPSNVTWNFTVDAKTGWLQIDNYWEGAVYDMRSYTYNVDPQVGWTKYSYLNNFDDLRPRRVYQETETHMLLEKTGMWRATAKFYYYDSVLQKNSSGVAEQWGNHTMTVSVYYDKSFGWVAQSASVTRFTPNSSAANYLVALPYAQESYDCTYQSTNRAPLTCHNEITGGTFNSARNGVSYIIYDDEDINNPIPGAAPTVGKPTAQRHATSDNVYADTFFTYDSFGNLIEQKTYTGTGVWQTYASTGKVHKTTFEYDDTGVYQEKVIQDLSASTDHTTLMEYDRKLGVPTSQTAPNGAESTITYDDYGRMTALQQTGYASPVVKIGYAINPTYSEVTTEILINSTTVTYAKQSKVNDGFGRVVQEIQHNAVVHGSSHTYIFADTWYDGWGTIYKTSMPYTAAARPSTPVRSTTVAAALMFHDGLGRPTVQIAPDGTDSSIKYSLPARADGWDLGVVATSTNARDNITMVFQDTFGQTSEIRPIGGTSVKYEYNVLGRLIKTDYGGAISTMTYDWAGRKTAMNDADMGAWSYVYDALGNLTRQTDARGLHTCLEYDELARLTKRTYDQNLTCNQAGVPADTFGYDSGANAIGYRTSMTDASGTTSWTYNALGRVTSETRNLGPTHGTFYTQYDYHPNGSLTRMTYPGNNSGGAGEYVDYTYNTQGMLTALVSPVGSKNATYAHSMTYDEAGRLQRRLQGALTTAYTYNPWTTQGGRLNQILVTNPSELIKLTYGYDANGNIESMFDSKLGSSGTASNYEYDSLDRLINRTVGVPGIVVESYEYSSATGNLTKDGSLSYEYLDNSSKHAATKAGHNTFAYDANGNMTWRTVGGTTHQFVYDGANRLTQVKNGGGTVIASFTYDGDGRRVIATEAGTTTVFIGNYFEWKNSAMTKYYYAGGQRLAVRNGNTSGTSQLSYLLTDHLGSTRLTYRADLATSELASYTAWGVASGAFTNTRYTYTGQYSYTATFGLMYYNARWYDPTLNRFAQADTIIPVHQGIQAYDRYAYVNNNPLKFNDPSGHGACSDEKVEECSQIDTNNDGKVYAFEEWELQFDDSPPTPSDTSQDEKGNINPKIKDATVLKYRELRYGLYKTYGWEAIDSTGRIKDPYLLAIILFGEGGSFGTGSLVYKEMVEALGNQFYDDDFSSYCSSTGCTTPQQIAILYTMEAVRKTSTDQLILNLTGHISYAGLAMNGYHNGSDSSWFWGNVDENGLEQYNVVLSTKNNVYPGKPFFIVYQLGSTK